MLAKVVVRAVPISSSTKGEPAAPTVPAKLIALEAPVPVSTLSLFAVPVMEEVGAKVIVPSEELIVEPPVLEIVAAPL